MAFPRLSASMLLASLILLFWTTSSAWSHDPTSSNLSPPHRVKRDLAYEARIHAETSMQLANSVLTVIKEGIEGIDEEDTRKLATVMKSLANVASWAPGIGGLIAAFVNMVLAFIPQDDPVLNEVKKGFAEVNRKLDSLSIQISNLATDVEWFNYASVYSQDEVRILNAWKKFTEFHGNSQLAKSEDDKLRLAEIFTNYYENTATEASVANLYHYLTVSGTSFSGNLNDLLRKKFKCGIYEIGKYNVYFSVLLWKGMVLNQLYWKLIGLSQTGKEAEHTQMFRNVYAAQISAINFCLDNYELYVKKDVEEISKALDPENKDTVADQVKKALDKKYYWYSWVVLVFNTKQDSYYLLYDMIKIPMRDITVAVDYTLKAPKIDEKQVISAADKCFEDNLCEIKDKVNNCIYHWSNPLDTSGILHSYPFTEYAKATHAAYGTEFAVVPKPFHQHDCLWGSYKRKISIHYSRRLSVCSYNTCMNNGKCNRLLDSNESLCECRDGYFGDRCEKSMDTRIVQIANIPQLPDITTINIKLNMMESKLEEILKTIKERCPHQ